MALIYNLTISNQSATVGQSPAPMLLLQAYNNGAAAVSVTGVVISLYDISGNQLRQAPVVPPSVAYGPGQNTSVAALSSSYLGPFALQVSGAMNVNPNQMTPVGTQPVNIQPSQPPSVTYTVGATVTASDGSITEAGRVQLLVSSWSQVPPLSQGGAAMFFLSTDSSLIAAMVG